VRLWERDRRRTPMVADTDIRPPQREQASTSAAQL